MTNDLWNRVRTSVRSYFVLDINASARNTRKTITAYGAVVAALCYGTLTALFLDPNVRHWNAAYQQQRLEASQQYERSWDRLFGPAHVRDNGTWYIRQDSTRQTTGLADADANWTISPAECTQAYRRMGITLHFAPDEQITAFDVGNVHTNKDPLCYHFFDLGARRVPRPSKADLDRALRSYANALHPPR